MRKVMLILAIALNICAVAPAFAAVTSTNYGSSSYNPEAGGQR